MISYLPALGQTDPAAQESWTDYLNPLVGAYATYMAAQDPRIMLAQTQARLENARARVNDPVLGAFYRNEVVRLQAREHALRERLALTREGEVATQQWRMIGQAAAGVGIVLGIGGIIYLTTAAIAKAR
jgi:hypothetical protein